MMVARRSPTRDDVKQRLTVLLNEIANVPTEQISEKATVDEELQMQSVAFVELQVAIEEEYDIQIDPIQIVELNEFGAIVDYIHSCATGASQ